MELLRRAFEARKEHRRGRSGGQDCVAAHAAVAKLHGQRASQRAESSLPNTARIIEGTRPVRLEMLTSGSGREADASQQPVGKVARTDLAGGVRDKSRLGEVRMDGRYVDDRTARRLELWQELPDEAERSSDVRGHNQVPVSGRCVLQRLHDLVRGTARPGSAVSAQQAAERRVLAHWRHSLVYQQVELAFADLADLGDGVFDLQAAASTTLWGEARSEAGVGWERTLFASAWNARMSHWRKWSAALSPWERSIPITS